jgi:hypothetical protein
MDGVLDSEPSHGWWFQVLWNPFDDVVPRNLRPKVEPADDKPENFET